MSILTQPLAIYKQIAQKGCRFLCCFDSCSYIGTHPVAFLAKSSRQQRLRAQRMATKTMTIAPTKMKAIRTSATVNPVSMSLSVVLLVESEAGISHRDGSEQLVSTAWEGGRKGLCFNA